jgi:hypothetical protein
MSLPVTFTNSLGELQILDANDYIGNMQGYLEKHEEYRVECSRKITVGIDKFELTEDEKLYTSMLLNKEKKI